MSDLLQRIKEFLTNPLHLLLSFVVLLILVGAVGIFYTSKAVQNFLSDRNTPPTSSISASELNLSIPILGTTSGKKSVNPESLKPEPPPVIPRGQIASGISTSRDTEAGSSIQGKPATAKPKVNTAYELQASPVAVETRENYSNETLASLEDTIRRSPDILNIYHITVNGRAALAYRTRTEFSHNIAYLEGSRIYYLVSKDFIHTN